MRGARKTRMIILSDQNLTPVAHWSVLATPRYSFNAFSEPPSFLFGRLPLSKAIIQIDHKTTFCLWKKIGETNRMLAEQMK